MTPRPLIVLALCAAAAGCGRSPQGAENAAFTADQQATGTASAVIVSEPTPPASAADFTAKAAAGDAFELQAAQAALQRAADPGVKSYAAMMIRDHGKSAADLSKAVANSGQSLPAVGSPSAEQQFALAELAHADAASFDKAYIVGQVKAHQAALTLMQDFAQNGDVPSLKAYAGRATAVVQHHYEMANQILGQLK